MSAIGTLKSSLVAPRMPALGGKTDMTVCGKFAFAVAIGAKRTCPFALHMSAFDPNRTSQCIQVLPERSDWRQIRVQFIRASCPDL
jgi:hypothetical protein